MIGNIRLNNLGTVNKNEVIIETDDNIFQLYFSYQILVGIAYYGHRATIQNYWSTTTGKLLNELEPYKEKRLTTENFEIEINKMFDLINGVN